MNDRIVRHRFEGLFLGAMAVAMFAAVFIGFQESYFRAGMIFAPLPSVIVHIHGALFVAWVLLLIAQVALVTFGHTRWHRRLGLLGAILAPLMFIVALSTLVLALRRNAVPRIPPALFFAGDLMLLTAFAVFIVFALRARNRRPDAHKRLMVFATIAILLPAIDRWPFSFMESLAAHIAVLTLFPLAIVAYDLATLRRVHTATRWGVLGYACMIMGSFVLPMVPLWQGFTAWVINA